MFAVTIIDEVNDGVNIICYGTWQAADATISPGAAELGTQILGGSAASPVSAAAEILPSGTIAVDASTPPAAETDTDITVTTDSFIPPSGSLLVALVGTDSNSTNVSVQITDSTGLTWRQLAYGTGSSWLGAPGCG